jgi:hypothetical protein
MKSAKEVMEITKENRPRIIALECAAFTREIEATVLEAAKLGHVHTSIKVPKFTDEDEAMKAVLSMLRGRGYVVSDLMGTVLRISWANV